MQLRDEYLINGLSFYKDLTEEEKELVKREVQIRELKKGDTIYNADSIWKGLKLITKGQIRLFISSEQGNGVTLYRIREGEMCLISLVCMLEPHLKASMGVDAEEDTEIYNIPADVYTQLMRENETVRRITDDISQKRFGEILSVISDLIFSNVEQRLARALVGHAGYSDSDTLKITHEILANDIGSAREVVTRNLKRLQNLGYLKLQRGKILIKDKKALEKIIQN